MRLPTITGKRTWSNDGRSDALRASSGLLSAVGQIVSSLEGVDQIRVLHRDQGLSKFFVIMKTPSLATIERVVDVMVQIEEKFPDDRFDYDTVPGERVALVPPEAAVLGHG
jgi:hypothetical protein